MEYDALKKLLEGVKGRGPSSGDDLDFSGIDDIDVDKELISYEDNDDSGLDFSGVDEAAQVANPTDEEIGKLETALYGSTQGAGLGLSEEAASWLLKYPEKLYQEVLESKQESDLEKEVAKIAKRRGKDIQVDPESFEGLQAQSLDDIYTETRDTARARHKKAQEQNPWTYGLSELGGGVATSIATGPAGLMAGAARTTAKEGFKAAAKQYGKAALAGGAEGAISGYGYSTEEELDKQLQDALIGGAFGSTFSVAAPMGVELIKKAGRDTASLVGATLDYIAKGEKAATSGYAYGKMGKEITVDQIKKDLDEISTAFLDNLQKAYDANDTKQLKKLLNELNHDSGPDIRKATEEAIEEIKSLLRRDPEGKYNKSVLPFLQKLIGDYSDEQLTLVEKAQIAAKKLEVESRTKPLEADIKAEKKIAKDQLVGNKEAIDVTEQYGVVDDIPGTIKTEGGEISGKKAKYEDVDGNLTDKSYVEDVTPYQGEITAGVEDNRNIVEIFDKGSGKTKALVGKLQTGQIDGIDVDTIKPDDLEWVRKYGNVIIDAFNPNKTHDDVERVLMTYNSNLRKLYDKIINESGNLELIEKTRKLKELIEMEKMTGLKDKSGRGKYIDDADKHRQIQKVLGFDKTPETSIYLDKALSRGGDDVFTPELQKTTAMLRRITSALGVGDMSNITGAGFKAKFLASGPNWLGRQVKSINEFANKPTVKGVTHLPENVLRAVSNKLKSRNKKAYTAIANQIDNVLGMPENQKAPLLHMLGRQTAIRQAIRDTIVEMRDEEEVDELSMTSDPENSTYASAVMPDNYSQREPAGDINEINWDSKNEVAPNIPIDFFKELASSESSFGSDQALEPEGNTVGIFHVKRSTALSYATPEDKEIIKNMTDEQFNEWVLNNPKKEYELAYRTAKGMKNSLESAIGHPLESFLNSNQIKAVLSYKYNTGSSPKTNHVKALKAAAEAKSEEEKKYYLDEAIRQMDIVTDGGSYSSGLDDRRSREKSDARTETPLEDLIYDSDLEIKAPYLDQINKPQEYEEPKVQEEIPTLNAPLEGETIAPELGAIKNDLERIMVQRGTGEKAPLSQLENLMARVNALNIADEDKNQINREAVAMNNPQDLRNLLARLQNLS